MDIKGVIHRIKQLVIPLTLLITTFLFVLYSDIVFNPNFWNIVISISVSLLGFGITAITILLTVFYGIGEENKAVKIVRQSMYFPRIFKFFILAVFFSFFSLIMSIGIVLVNETMPYEYTKILDLFALYIFFLMLYLNSYIIIILRYIIRVLVISSTSSDGKSRLL